MTTAMETTKWSYDNPEICENMLWDHFWQSYDNTVINTTKTMILPKIWYTYRIYSIQYLKWKCTTFNKAARGNVTVFVYSYIEDCITTKNFIEGWIQQHLAS